MGEPSSTIFLLGGCIGLGLMLLGFYTFRRLDPAMPVRVGLGAVMLVVGLIAVFYWPGIAAVGESPFYIGVTLVLLGLGINQLAAPVRRAIGKAV